MTTMTDLPAEHGVLGSHPNLVSFVLGALSGLTAGGLLIGGVALGYPVGRSAGSRGIVIGTIASILGSTVLFAWLVISMVNSGCPSCMDAVIFGWIVPLFYAVPFLIGCGIGSWRRRRANPSR
jgi:hypothetical protein